MSKDARGPITDQVLTHACGGKMPKDFADIAGITARTQKLVNHTRTESMRNRVFHTTHISIYVITITLNKVASPFLHDNRKSANVRYFEVIGRCRVCDGGRGITVLWVNVRYQLTTLSTSLAGKNFF